MRVLLTGGAGFIGSNLAEYLLERGYHVTVFDNFITGKRENVKELKKIASKHGQLEVVEGDIRDLKSLKKATKNKELVFHQAALPSVVRSIQDPVLTSSINIIGTINVLKTAHEENVKRVVYASSSSVYGLNPVPQREEMFPMPLSPYAVTKLAGEHYCRVFFETYGLETVILRYFNVFGPKQDASSEYAAVVPKFITALLDNAKPTVYGDGEQSRDFTYVKNVCEANLLAAKAKNAAGKVFNIGCGKSTSVNALLSEISKIVGKRTEPVYAEKREGDIRDSLADISRAEKILNYKPKYGLSEGLKETVKWLAANKKGGKFEKRR